MDELMELIDSPIVAINVGIQDFGSALVEQGIEVVFVEWRPSGWRRPGNDRPS